MDSDLQPLKNLQNPQNTDSSDPGNHSNAYPIIPPQNSQKDQQGYPNSGFPHYIPPNKHPNAFLSNQPFDPRIQMLGQIHELEAQFNTDGFKMFQCWLYVLTCLSWIGVLNIGVGIVIFFINKLGIRSVGINYFTYLLSSVLTLGLLSFCVMQRNALKNRAYKTAKKALFTMKIFAFGYFLGSIGVTIFWIKDNGIGNPLILVIVFLLFVIIPLVITLTGSIKVFNLLEKKERLLIELNTGLNNYDL